LEKIASADLFVVLDDLMLKPELFERRNRYYCFNAGEPRFLTIPTEKKRQHRHLKITDLDFAKKHRRILKDNYWKRTARFDEDILNEIVFDPANESFLEYYTESLARTMKLLGFHTEIALSSQVASPNVKTERLNDILRYHQADTYLSGACGAEYMGEDCCVPVVFRRHEEEVSRFHSNSNTDMMLMFIDTLFDKGLEFTKGLLHKND
jgi:hypothetical protein